MVPLKVLGPVPLYLSRGDAKNEKGIVSRQGVARVDAAFSTFRNSHLPFRRQQPKVDPQRKHLERAYSSAVRAGDS
jgi:hypothetical protein